MISLDDLHFGHCFSAGAQPTIDQLNKSLQDPTKKVTLVLGAGLSIDAGMPTWDRLIEQICLRITPPAIAQLALADRDEPMRKAEYAIEMLLQSIGGTESAVIQSALYANTSTVAPGALGNSVAQLIHSLGDRVSVITTNYDEVLEVALDKADPSIKSSCRIVSYPLRQDKAWKKAVSQPDVIPIMHLHGYVPRVGDSTGPLILTESHFLQYGSRARALVRDALQNSVVLFLGVSLTDPNLVGPVWDTLSTRSANPDSYIVHVPTQPSPNVKMYDSRYYALEKFKYFEDKLKVKTIFLKSYSQQQQLMAEQVISIHDPASYGSTDPTNSMNYGLRFTRVLTLCYSNAGWDTASDRMPRAQALGVSDRLGQLLAKPTSPTGSAVGAVSAELDRIGNEPSVQRMLNSLRARHSNVGTEPEDFGLYLWLRSQDSGATRRYALNLIAASSFILFGELRRRRYRDIAITPKSPFQEARAVYFGSPRYSNLPRSDALTGWRSCLAVPVLQLETLINSAGQEYYRTTTVGAIGLTSTGIKPNDASMDLFERPISILSAMGSSTIQLNGVLELAARDILGIRSA